MTSIFARLLPVALVAFAALPALAQDVHMPSPFGIVPPGRSAQLGIAAATPAGVFGGREVSEGAYPFQVALLRSDGLSDNPESQYESQFCGGALIAPRWVLTAAHCMVDDDITLAPERLTVLSGSVDLMKGRRLAASRVLVNPQYDPYTMDHDVALIELAAPADVEPLALDDGTTPASGAIVLGWGMTETGVYPRYLLGGEIEVVPSDACDVGIKAIYATNLRASLKTLGAQYRIGDSDLARIGDEMADKIANPLTATMLCAGLKSGRRDACYGDSGGPLFAMVAGRPTQVGIVSWGEGPSGSDVKCGHQDVYGVYSRVSTFRDWILAQMAGGGNGP